MAVRKGGDSKSTPAIARSEAKWRFTWVRDRDWDLSDPSSTGGQTNREADQRISPDGQKAAVASISGGIDGDWETENHIT